MIGQRLKWARQRKNLKQNVLGQMVGVSASAISQYEQNKKFPRKDVFLKLLNILEVSPEYILGHDACVATNDTNYTIFLSKKDIEIINTIKKYPKLYNLLSSERTDDIIKYWASKQS